MMVLGWELFLIREVSLYPVVNPHTAALVGAMKWKGGSGVWGLARRVSGFGLQVSGFGCRKTPPFFEGPLFEGPAKNCRSGGRLLGLSCRLGGDNLSELSATYQPPADKSNTDNFPQGSFHDFI